MTTTQTISPAQVKTIDVNAKEWFDKVNGNSYFAALVSVNYGMEDAQVIKVPFQYGYGDQYRYAAFKALQDAGIIPQQESNVSYWRYFADNDIVARHSIQTNCLKRDLKAFTS